MTRLEASPARTTMRFTISEVSDSNTVVPVGTRVTKDGRIQFETVKTVEIPAGESCIDVTAVCTQAGVIGNGFPVGSISVCVDRDNVTNLLSVTNLTVSEGGAERETDEAFYQRMRESLSAYSTAGSEQAYIYHTKSASALVGGVKVTSPRPGDVVIYFNRTDGKLPGEELIQEVLEYLSAETVRPLTDHLTVSAPEAIDFDIQFTWYRETDCGLTQEELEARVENALTAYIEWQTTEIGRDINPSKLIYYLMESGIKRVHVTSPAFTVLEDYQVAQVKNQTVTYGGTEDG